MKTLGKFALAMLCIGLVLALLAAAAGSWALMRDGLPGASALVEIDGERIAIAELGVGGALLAVGGVTLALLVVAVVVPSALLLAFGMVALALVVTFGALLGVAVLLLAPLLVPVGLGWWLWRRSRRSAVADGGTIGAQ
jgi:hypothetical protein